MNNKNIRESFYQCAVKTCKRICINSRRNSKHFKANKPGGYERRRNPIPKRRLK